MDLHDFLANYALEATGAPITPASHSAGEGRGLNGESGRVEWAVAWPVDEDDFFNSYCNTVPTPQGGTHEAGLRTALTRGPEGVRRN